MEVEVPRAHSDGTHRPCSNRDHTVTFRSQCPRPPPYPSVPKTRAFLFREVRR